MKTTLFRILLCVVLSVTAAAPTFAKAKKPKTTPVAHEPVISAVSGNTITVTDDNSAKTITISPLTDITLNGQKATFADLKPGMTVSLVLSSPMQASRITATTKK